MRHFILLLKIWVVLGLCYSTPLWAQVPNSYQACVACHGDKGQGNPQLKAPQLAGQHSWYLQRQLQHFASDLRGQHSKDNLGQQMKLFASALSADDVRQINDYLAAQQPVLPTHNLQGDLKNGSRYYQAKCGACHGGKGEGNKAFQAPALVNLSPAYLQRQMHAFKQGIRGTEKADKYGRQMAMMAKTVSDTELADIVFFIAELQQ